MLVPHVFTLSCQASYLDKGLTFIFVGTSNFFLDFMYPLTLHAIP